MYDLLVVGAGITAATLAAQLKDRLRICVIDCRPHLGGNCFDQESQGTLIHRYGPHIFHCSNPRVVAFLSRFTEWKPYTHTVTAEILNGSALKHVPFPYCRQTIDSLGQRPTETQVIDLFFRDYSRKMWGMDWEKLPHSVRGRIPTELTDTPVYYRDGFVALPRRGYTHMLGNMLEGVEVILGAPPWEWTQIRAATIVYTGRPDMIPRPSQGIGIGEADELRLDFRMLDVTFEPEDWPFGTVCLHACTMKRPWTRKTCYVRMTGGRSPLVSVETPRQASQEEWAPFYPIEIPRNQRRLAAIKQRLATWYPNLCLLGRLGTYRYLDMFQAVEQALTLADHRWKK